MVLEQFSVFNRPCPHHHLYLSNPPPPLRTSPAFVPCKGPSGAWRTLSQLRTLRGFFFFFFVICGSYNWNAPQRICDSPPLHTHSHTHTPPVSIADKDNDCEVSEPSNVRQSLSSGSLLRHMQNEDRSHYNSATASLIMMIPHHFCHFRKVGRVH